MSTLNALSLTSPRHSYLPLVAPLHLLVVVLRRCAPSFVGCRLWPLASPHLPSHMPPPLITRLCSMLSHCVALPGALASLSPRHCAPLIEILMLLFGWLQCRLYWPPFPSLSSFSFLVACCWPGASPPPSHIKPSPLSTSHCAPLDRLVVMSCRTIAVPPSLSLHYAPWSLSFLFPWKKWWEISCRQKICQHRDSVAEIWPSGQK